MSISESTKVVDGIIDRCPPTGKSHALPDSDGWGASRSTLAIGVLGGPRSVVAQFAAAGPLRRFGQAADARSFGLMAVCLTVTRGIELFSGNRSPAGPDSPRERFEDARDTAFCIMVVRGVVLALVACAIAPVAASVL